MPNLRLDIPNTILGIVSETRTEIDFGDKAGVQWRRDVIGGDETAAVFKKLGTFVNMNTARVVSVIIADLLAMAQPRVPVDTGKLRESGRAFLQFGRTYKNVAKGHKDGTVTVDHSRVTKTEIERATQIMGEVHYSRLSDDRSEEGIRDVAQWTHEYLNYYGEESPAARTPGTGPKYLENAWEDRRNDYIFYIRDEIAGKGFETELGKHLHRKTKKKGEFTLNYVDLWFR